MLSDRPFAVPGPFTEIFTCDESKSRGSVQMISLPQASITSSVFDVPSLICEIGVPPSEEKMDPGPVGTTYDVRNLPLESTCEGRAGQAYGRTRTFCRSAFAALSHD